MSHSDPETGSIPSTSSKEDRPSFEPEKAEDSHGHGPSDAPNGGIKAWLQVAGAFSLFFNTWGVVNMWGAFQTVYQLDTDWQRSASDIAWIGSLQGFLLFFGSAAAGPAFDMGYLRTLLTLGTFLTTFGMMMASICNTYWQAMLAQGLCVGIGMGCLFLPSVAIVSQYFTTKKAFAFGIASTGSSLGGVLYPLIFRQLEPQIGFGWATRVVAFIIFITMLVPLFGMEQKAPPAQSRREFLDLSAFKDKPFSIFSAGTFLGFMGVYVTFFYIQLYAIEKTDTNSYLTSYLLSIINAASTFGRLVPNFIADKTGPLNIQGPFAFVCSLLCFCWIAVSSEAGILVFCILYGFFCGSFVSLPGVTVISLSPNLKTIGIQLGMVLTISGCGLLIGGPIAGAILSSSSGWVGLQVWCGVLLALSGAMSVTARVLKVGPSLRAKA